MTVHFLFIVHGASFYTSLTRVDRAPYRAWCKTAPAPAPAPAPMNEIAADEDHVRPPGKETVVLQEPTLGAFSDGKLCDYPLSDPSALFGGDG